MGLVRKVRGTSKRSTTSTSTTSTIIATCTRYARSAMQSALLPHQGAGLNVRHKIARSQCPMVQCQKISIVIHP